MILYAACLATLSAANELGPCGRQRLPAARSGCRSAAEDAKFFADVAGGGVSIFWILMQAPGDQAAERYRQVRPQHTRRGRIVAQCGGQRLD